KVTHDTRALERYAPFRANAERHIAHDELGFVFHVEDRRQSPLSAAVIEESVVLEMIVLVRHENREDHALIEFAEVGGWVGAVSTHEVNDLGVPNASAVLPRAVRAEM